MEQELETGFSGIVRWKCMQEPCTRKNRCDLFYRNAVPVSGQGFTRTFAAFPHSDYCVHFRVK